MCIRDSCCRRQTPCCKNPRRVHRSSCTSTSSRSFMARHQPTGGQRRQQQTLRSKTTPPLNAHFPTSTSRLRTSNRHSCRLTVHLQSRTFNNRVTNQPVRGSDDVVDDPGALTPTTCTNNIWFPSHAYTYTLIACVVDMNPATKTSALQ